MPASREKGSLRILHKEEKLKSMGKASPILQKMALQLRKGLTENGAFASLRKEEKQATRVNDHTEGHSSDEEVSLIRLKRPKGKRKDDCADSPLI